MKYKSITQSEMITDPKASVFPWKHRALSPLKFHHKLKVLKLDAMTIQAACIAVLAPYRYFRNMFSNGGGLWLLALRGGKLGMIFVTI